MKLEHDQADNLDEKLKNPVFGFKCLHYSVSEASESLTIMVLNKTGEPGRVFIQSIDDAAKAGEDFEEVKMTVRKA